MSIQVIRSLLWVGKKTGKSPVDRGKLGSKKSVLCDGRGIPLAVAVHASNQHDSKTLDEVLGNVALGEIPRGSKIFGDKGYDDWTIIAAFDLLGIEAIIPKRGKKPVGRPMNLGKHRWMVERTHSWMNQFRRIRTRWEKQSENYLGLIQLACAIITFREVLG